MLPSLPVAVRSSTFSFANDRHALDCRAREPSDAATTAVSPAAAQRGRRQRARGDGGGGAAGQAPLLLRLHPSGRVSVRKPSWPSASVEEGTQAAARARPPTAPQVRGHPAARAGRAGGQGRRVPARKAQGALFRPRHDGAAEGGAEKGAPPRRSAAYRWPALPCVRAPIAHRRDRAPIHGAGAAGAAGRERRQGGRQDAGAGCRHANGVCVRVSGMRRAPPPVALPHAASAWEAARNMPNRSASLAPHSSAACANSPGGACRWRTRACWPTTGTWGTWASTCTRTTTRRPSSCRSTRAPRAWRRRAGGPPRCASPRGFCACCVRCPTAAQRCGGPPLRLGQ